MAIIERRVHDCCSGIHDWNRMENTGKSERRYAGLKIINDLREYAGRYSDEWRAMVDSLRTAAAAPLIHSILYKDENEYADSLRRASLGDYWLRPWGILWRAEIFHYLQFRISPFESVAITDTPDVVDLLASTVIILIKECSALCGTEVDLQPEADRLLARFALGGGNWRKIEKAEGYFEWIQKIAEIRKPKRKNERKLYRDTLLTFPAWLNKAYPEEKWERLYPLFRASYYIEAALCGQKEIDTETMLRGHKTVLDIVSADPAEILNLPPLEGIPESRGRKKCA